MSNMYKVVKVEGGYDVFWIESPEHEPRLVPHTNELGQVVPYVHRQAAYRRCKKLNDAVEKVDQMIAESGAIIV